MNAVHANCNQRLFIRLFRNLEEIEKLSELGVLFLLFEMGLELSFDRLKVRNSLPITKLDREPPGHCWAARCV